MFQRVTQYLGAALIFFCAMPAYAATVSLVPESLVVQEGSQFTVDLVLNAADEIVAGKTADSPAIGGEIITSFNNSLVRYDGFAIDSPALLVRQVNDPAVNPDTVSLGFETAAYVGVVGTFTFTAIGGAGSINNFSLADADDFFGSFVNIFGTNQGFTPNFVGTSVEIAAIPAPAAAWLFASALGLLGLRARSRQA